MMTMMYAQQMHDNTRNPNATRYRTFSWNRESNVSAVCNTAVGSKVGSIVGMGTDVGEDGIGRFTALSL